MQNIQNQSLLRAAGFIGGEWSGADDGETFAVENPANGEIIARIPQMGAAETRRAVAAAEKAFPDWRAAAAKDRAAALLEWHRLILQNKEDLARLMTLEQGKPLAESRGEVQYGASFAQWFAEECKRCGGEIVPPSRAGTEIRVTREAAGVAALITPWNFPIAMIMRKAAPALAAGCTVAAKPASQTPLCAIALAALAEEAGVPPGVFNLIPGDARAVGGELCANPRVRVLSFTGSTEVGRLLAAACAPGVKKLALELGGNAPFIVFDDADLPRAAAQLMMSKFRNAGQTCVCANRIYVQRGAHSEFAALLKEKILALKTGDGLREDTDIGPLIDEAAVQKAENHVRECISGGASALVAGGRCGKGGRFFAPALLDNVSDGAPPCREETFAPVAPLFVFDKEEEAVRRANDSIHGLSAYVCTKDLGRAMRVSAALEAGIVGVNEGIISTEVAPFGGVKQSGVGREGGAYGMDEYTEIKYTLFGY
ncbi:MAG: NAD-dependent succinate-semialdehyde dehydrogenase [Gammaproteobacteria bacterium]